MKQVLAGLFTFTACFFGGVIAQQVPDLGINVAQVPVCALTCAKQIGIPVTCFGNPSCICGNNKFMNDVACCVAQRCSISDLAMTQQFSGQLCKIVDKALPKSPSCTGLVTTTQTSSTAKPTATWAYQGCFTESTNYNRALNGTFFIDTTRMTPETCQSFCKSKGYNFAGVEYTQECWCGKEIQYVNGAKKLLDDSRCNLPCTGDSKKKCGGAATLNIYKEP